LICSIPACCSTNRTNHLDVNAVEWLEATLRDYHGGLIIVSHDRSSSTR
jgi:hypothetical protein